MEELLLDIAKRLRAGETLDENTIANLIRAHNKARHRTGEPGPDIAKKHLLPYYLNVKHDDAPRFESWGIDAALERRLFETLRMKPHRSMSGVATITVITKPWPCTGGCSYCPSDIRMPKSYLHNEPACQRAERAYFDPYLQVNARLTALTEMGHITDKVELIVLGGTWGDYPRTYQAWFVHELFRALNEFGTLEASHSADERSAFYERVGLSNDGAALAQQWRTTQGDIDALDMTYNDAWKGTYGTDSAWSAIAARQTATLEQLATQQATNETATHRCVGLVMETRPPLISADSLLFMRRLGCTKVQVGVQSLRQDLLDANTRRVTPQQIARSFDLLRLFGFKVHAHFMANLLGADVASDKADYERFVTDPQYCPDEIKLYPCLLIAGTRLFAAYQRGEWRPYSDEELLELLVADVLATPAWTRISRMVRDFSASDIAAGSTTANLRQLVEERAACLAADRGEPVQEIRMREIAGDKPDVAQLRLDEKRYETNATTEHFLQWITEDNRIAGFLRLSLPKADAVAALGDAAPFGLDEAMIREVHVYGKTTAIGDESQGVQHIGLGKQLIARACDIAHSNGYQRINVISAIGTRAYYAALGFQATGNGLYQAKELS